MSGRKFEARWHPSGRMGAFFSSDPNSLRCAWTDGADTRWDGKVVIGPEFGTIDVTSVGSSVNVKCQAVVQDASGNPYIYVSRGTGVAKIEPSTMTLITAGAAVAGPGAAITSMIATKAPNGAWTLSIFDGTNAYQVRTAIAVASEADTASTNDESSLAKVAYAADDNDRVYAIENLSTTKGWTVMRNVLSTSVNMDASNWVHVSSLSAGATPTSMSITEDLLIVGTDKGPQILNLVSGKFLLDIARVTKLSTNCLAMVFVDWLGVVMGVENQIRVQAGADSRRIGPSLWIGNNGGIQGRMQGVSFDPTYLYCAVRNPVTSVTYFLMARPGNDPGEDGLEWHCIGNQTEDCEMFAYWGTVDGDRTQPVFGGGKGTDAVWYALAGRTNNWLDDTAYRFQTNKDYTWYGTELRLNKPARLTGWRIEGSSMSATQTITLKALVSGNRNAAETRTVGIKSIDGWERFDVPMNNIPAGTRFQPQMVLRTAASTASPTVVGDIVLEFEEVA